MDIPVIISIKGVQSAQDQQDEVIEFVTAGRMTGGPDEGYVISYQESELTGLEGTLTTFQVEPHRIILMRTGKFNSQMVFEEGRKHLSQYATPYGELIVGVNTRKAKSSIGDTGGDIEIDYSVEVDDALLGDNAFRINVRQPDPGVKQ